MYYAQAAFLGAIIAENSSLQFFPQQLEYYQKYQNKKVKDVAKMG